MKRYFINIVTIILSIFNIIRLFNLGYSATQIEGYTMYDIIQEFTLVIPYIISNLTISILLLISTMKKPKDIDENWGISLAAFFATNLSLILILLDVNLLNAQSNSTIIVIGFFLQFFILPFYILSVLQLGKSFTILPEAHELKTTGIYSFCRHPLYTYYIACYIIQICVGQTWLVVLVSAIQFSLQMVRVKHEERLLMKCFPEYKDYKKEVLFFGRRSWFPFFK